MFIIVNSSIEFHWVRNKWQIIIDIDIGLIT
jgi:hypothetical protein